MTKSEADPSDPISDLQSRLRDLELSKAHNDASEILRKERAEMLLSLRKISEAMKKESAGGGASSKEVDDLRAENEELKKINAKQQYRIEHLVHNLRELLEARDEKQ
ncbi:hypothetical protein ACHAWF_017967 [Thalassiosira exigua]